jgi:drug/metabolite transporter (DMT)-like permease
MGNPARRLGTADLLLAISAVTFGALPIFGRFAYAQGMNVQSVLATRFLVAGLVLVPAAITSILLYTYPVIVTVLSRPIYGVPLTRVRVMALGAALVGTVLVASPSGGLQLRGVVLGLLSALFYSAYILGGKRVIERVDPWLATAVISLSAGLAYLTYSVAGNTFSPPPNTTAWLAVLGLSVVSTVIGAGAFLAGLRLTDPGRASLISTLEPVSTALLAALFFGELLGGVQLVGGALVLTAVLIIARHQPGEGQLPESQAV